MFRSTMDATAVAITTAYLGGPVCCGRCREATDENPGELDKIMARPDCRQPKTGLIACEALGGWRALSKLA